MSQKASLWDLAAIDVPKFFIFCPDDKIRWRHAGVIGSRCEAIEEAWELSELFHPSVSFKGPWRELEKSGDSVRRMIDIQRRISLS